MENFVKRLNLGEPTEEFSLCYKKAVATEGVPHWLTEEFLEDAHAKMNCFSRYMEELKRGAKAVRENPDLLLFAKTMYYLMQDYEKPKEKFLGMNFPQAPEGADPLGYDLVVVYPLAAHTEKAYLSLIARGIDEELVKRTYNYIEGCINGSKTRCGRVSFIQFYFGWSIIYLRAHLLRLDRFNFEITKADIFLNVRCFRNEQGEIRMFANGKWIDKSGLIYGSAGCKDPENVVKPYILEDDTFIEGYPVNPETWRIEPTPMRMEKAGWEEFVTQEDWVLNIHIPKDGSFDTEACLHAYNYAREFYKKYFPDYDIKAFVCRSWLLSRDLEKILKPTSNILGFQRQFHGFPVVASGRGVFNFVFSMAVNDLAEVDYDALAEDTSLQRGIKQTYKNGDYIHEWAGLFPF